MTTLDDIHNTWDRHLPPPVDDDEYTTHYRWLVNVARLHPAVAAVMADEHRHATHEPRWHALQAGRHRRRTREAA